MGKIENDKARMLQNEHFVRAFDYVAEAKGMTQTHLASVIGSKASYISKYRNGTRPVQEEEIDALIRISATIPDGQIYRPFLTGDSEYMLLRNVPDDEVIEVDRRRNNPDYELMKQRSTPTRPIEHSSLVNAALAAKDETIAELRERILDLQGRIKDKEDVIQTKDALIVSLRQQLESASQIRTTKPYPLSSDERLPIAAENR